MELIEDADKALRPDGMGFAVFVDEIQDLESTTLTALLTAQHRAAQEGWHFYLIGAGLPSVPGVLSESRSYAERQFDYRQIDKLSDDDAGAAITEPARGRGARFTSAALERLVAVSGQYPYFIQEYGYHAWEVAAQAVIDVDDANAAAVLGTAALDDGFFRARWERATKAEKKLMSAMALDEDTPSALNDLVGRLGKRRPSDLSVARRGLIDKGLIYASSRGELAFTVPHMADYIARSRVDQ